MAERRGQYVRVGIGQPHSHRGRGRSPSRKSPPQPQHRELAPPSGDFPRGLLLDGHPPKTQVLAGGETPNILTDGTVSMFVIHRGNRYPLRLKDSHSSARLHFHGLKWYAPNEKYWNQFLSRRKIRSSSLSCEIQPAEQRLTELRDSCTPHFRIKA